jgi:plastocyanin
VDGGEAVTVKEFTFNPGTIQIAPGTQVVWTNEDTVQHTVTSGKTTGAENQTDGVFNGKLPNKGTTFTHTFDEPGVFTYFCSQHNVMNGTIEVEEAS